MLIQQKILLWYWQNQRNLPWRKTHDPYKILISEVMLQQTQVDRVVPKYKQFLKLFPTVQKLATAKTSDVLKAWAGLGYNRRALYLQKTAQALVEKYKGKFPKDLELLKELPGIGDYTARAILSFAFQEPVPVLDTNHRKFYQRTYFGKKIKTDEQLLKKAQGVISELPTNTIYDWNQALMDFMSAVSSQTKDEFVLWYQRTFPAYKKEKVVKKTAIKFEDTDRYFRGRIIDLLREKNKTTIQALQKKFSHIPVERMQKIVLRLQKDGLIIVKKKSILFP